jgi:hypothetical protein
MTATPRVDRDDPAATAARKNHVIDTTRPQSARRYDY